MDAMTKKELEIIATRIRMAIIEGTYNAGSGHPGGSLSIADDLAYLYWKEMHIDPANPEYKEAKNRMRARSAGYGQEYTTVRGSDDCDCCGLCTTLLCADSCCECCGGDIISCC